MMWPFYKMSQVAEINPRDSHWKQLPDDTMVSFVPMPAVSEITASIEDAEIRPLGEVRRGYTYFRDNDVLFAKITPCMENGKVALAQHLKSGLGFGSTEFHVIRSKDGVLPRYLYFFVRQPSFRRHAKQRMRGAAGQQRVPKQFLVDYLIPLPPPSEQRRIVELLDRADALRRMRRDADALAERVLPALFYQMFGDPATNPMGWPQKPLSSLCKIVSGATPKTKIESYYGGSICWATPKDLSELQGWVIEKTARTLTEEGYQSSSTTLVPPGTVLVSSRAPIGLLAIAGTELCTNQGIKSLVPGPEIDSWYLFAWLYLRRSYLESLGRGAIFKEISTKILGSLEIPIPPLSVQKTWADRIQDHLEIICLAQKNKQALDDLFTLMLQRAFSGELTAAWREAHLKELLQEMETQARHLGLSQSTQPT